ncbi:MAG: hypothetical protein PHY48_14145 [Candidatus Cloacimonetes bacterium]|nr:hypothetical protein [Candidatus Cloacimonadota bacterium]
MPSKQQVHIDKVLTNLSVKYVQDASNFIAGQVFPMVPVAKQSDLFYTYQREDWFRDDAQLRAMGTESVGGDYELGTDTYYAQRYAFHKNVYDEERANSDDPLSPDADATMFVTDKILLNKENNWARTFFRAGVWATDLTGAAVAAAPNQVVFWDDYLNSDPIIDISERSTTIAEVTGKEPNTLVLGRRVYNALKHHPDIIDRIRFSQKGVVTTDLMAELFDVDRILVANAIQNVANKGQNAQMQYILGNNALLCYTAPSAGLRMASAGYTFTWTGLMGSAAWGGRINRIPNPLLGIGTERIEVELCYDMKVIAADMGVLFSNIVR